MKTKGYQMKTTLKVKKTKELMTICYLSDIGKYSPVEVGLNFGEEVINPYIT